MKILIEGWRNFTHSFAMVNQYQILEFLRRPDIQLYHHDIALGLGKQTSPNQNAGFDPEDNWIINNLALNAPENLDAVYRIHSPYNLLPLNRGQLLIFMVTEFGLDLSEFGFNDATLPEFHRTLDNFHASGGIIATPSEWSRQRIIHFGFHPDHVQVIAHGAHPKYFYPLTAEARNQQRESLGFRPDEIILLNVGVATWNKGIDILLMAFAQARQKRQDLRLIIKDQRNIYNIDTEEFIINVLSKYNLLSPDILRAITIIPRNLNLEQLRHLYGMIDYYISPYRAEGFNLPVIEAMACGAKVIVTQGGSTDEFIIPELALTIPAQKFEQTQVRDIITDAYLQPDEKFLTEILLNIIPWQPPSNFSAPLFPWRVPMDKLLNLIPNQQAILRNKRSIHIYCDGGLGNRFNTLIAGYIIADQTDLFPIVVWPINNWCGADYAAIFESGATVCNRELLTYVSEKDNFQFLITEDHLKMGMNYLSPLDLPDSVALNNYLQSSTKDVFYHAPLIPNCLTQDAVLDKIRKIPWKITILQRARDFIRRHQLKEFLGIQIRKTDFGANGADDHSLYNFVRDNPTRSFFICSDDHEVENHFRQLPNVAIYPKQEYVIKRVPGDWNTFTADHSGRIYPCNVERSAQSVIDAAVDILILAQSRIIQTSHSTFLMTAILLQKAFSQLQSSAPVIITDIIPKPPQPTFSIPILPVFEIINNLALPTPSAMLKIGAGAGTDLRYFLENGVTHGLFVEPDGAQFTHLSELCQQIPNYVAVNLLCADLTGKKHYFESSGTQQEVTTITVDDLYFFMIEKGFAEIIKKLDLMYLATPGQELSILRAAPHLLKQIRYLLIEINLAASPSGFGQLCCFLEVFGFLPRHLVTQNYSLALFVGSP